MVAYLTHEITDMKSTPTPRYGMGADGYTLRGGAPTSKMIKLAGEKRWRRLMVWQFSNVGTLFIRIKGQALVVNEHSLPQPANANS